MAMPHSIHASIGMPTICQPVCRPIRNIGACENTPATISAQPDQKATGWWKPMPPARTAVLLVEQEERLDGALDLQGHGVAAAVEGLAGRDPHPALADAVLLDVGAFLPVEA